MKIFINQIRNKSFLSQAFNYSSLAKDVSKLNQEELIKGTKPTNLNKLYKIRNYNAERPDKHNLVLHTKPNDTQQKVLLERLVNRMLNEEGVTTKESEEFKKEVRQADYGFRFDNLSKITDKSFGLELEKDFDFGDLMIAEKSFLQYKFLYKYHQEQKKYLDPLFSKLDSMERNDVYGYNKLENYKKTGKWYPHKNEISPNKEDIEAGKKQERFELDYNYNFEENKVYTREYTKAKEIDNKKTDYENKLLAYIKNNPDSKHARRFQYKSHIPIDRLNISPDILSNPNFLNWEPEKTQSERKKRVDKHSKDLKDFDCWRSFNVSLPYTKRISDNGRKIRIVPKKLISRFGPPGQALEYDMTGSYYFQDTNLDVFVLFDWQQTTKTWGPNMKDEDYIKQEENTIPSHRRIKFLTPEEFWNSEEPQEFKFNFTKLAERRKFYYWLLREVDAEEVTDINELLDKKFGKINLYQNYESPVPSENRKPVVYEYSQEFVTGKENPKIHFPKIYPPKAISLNDPDAELFDNKFYIKQKALKGLQRTEEDK